MRYAQLVIGPAGSGKSTYCSALQTHAVDSSRNIHVVNLDPAAERFEYTALADVRDLVQVSDVMEAEDMNYGPNGALVFCMEYLVEPDGIEWLKEQLGDMDEDYILFDCPGQIELCTHMNVIQRLSGQLLSMDFRVCAVFLLDSHYMVDGAKFLSGSLTALAAMVKLELPQINVVSKMDLLSKEARRNLESFLDPDGHDLLASAGAGSRFNRKYHDLTTSLGRVLDEYALVRFLPLNVKQEESIGDLLLQVDSTLQFGEEADVKTTDFEYPDAEEEDGEEREAAQEAMDFFHIS